MRLNRVNETLKAQETVAQIEKKTQKDDEVSKPFVKEVETMRLEKDSLFREFWNEDAASSSSNIAKLMEERIQEEARRNTKSGKLNSDTRTDSRRFKIDEIMAG